MELTDADLERYARQIVLPEVGGRGQERLKRASVLVIGAGGLGAPLLLYLAAAGIGRIGIVDHDRIDTSNLQRQIMFETAETGESKVERAAARLGRLNPGIVIEPVERVLDEANAAGIVRGFDIVADGCDNMATRLAVHDACLAAGVPLVSASVQGMDGQLTTYKAHLGPPHPCLRCLYGTMPDDGVLPSCAQGGVLGAAAGVMGSLQAAEVIKELIGGGPGLSGRLLLYDARTPSLDEVRVPRRADCPQHGAASSDDHAA